MKSGLGDRNNLANCWKSIHSITVVSMKSGLGDRNNTTELDAQRCTVHASQ